MEAKRHVTAERRHYLDRAIELLRRAEKTGMSKRELERVLDLYKSAGLWGEIAELRRSAGEYLSHSERSILDRILGKLGRAGAVLQSIFRGGQRLTHEQVDAAQELIRSAQQLDKMRRRDVSEPAAAAAARTQRRDKDESTFSRIFRTPQSTNVYSFQYDYSSSTLYVRYQAPQLNPKHTSIIKDGVNPPQFVGELGRSMFHKLTGAPGVLYAYDDVPVRVFQRLINNWAIPLGRGGIGVWDELRVRGTVYGTQYRYRVASAADLPRGSESARYVPRMATHRGLRRRAAAEPGSGRRGAATSMLPERTEPERGRPKRQMRRR